MTEENELEQLRKKVALYEKIFTHSLWYDKAGVYFICGESGPKDKNGLPDKIWVCPIDGLDWFQIYEKTDKTEGPGW